MTFSSRLLLEIMTRFPSSDFWFLNPQSENSEDPKKGSDLNALSHSSVRSQFQSKGEIPEYFLNFATGISSSRIKFVDRRNKEEHIRRYVCSASPPFDTSSRHEEVDLFLDTMVYGAHSTASDALKGVIPLTMSCHPSEPFHRVVQSLRCKETLFPVELPPRCYLPLMTQRLAIYSQHCL